MGEIRAKVAMSGGVQPGLLQWLAFSMLDPYQTFFGRWHKLANEIMFNQDEEKCKQKVSNNLWLDDPKNLGKWFEFTLEHFFIGNRQLKRTLI